MKEVWIVEEGEYSDYHVSGIFSTEKDAQRACDVINDGDGWSRASISKRQLDPSVDEMNAGLVQFDVSMRINGDIKHCKVTNFIVLKPSLIHRKNSPRWEDGVYGSVWAKDQTHAIKIVNEKRAQFIALDM
jgi:hypothetical protein